MALHRLSPARMESQGRSEMTLQEFLTLTTEVDDRDLRPALALALQSEVPRSRESYARFYRRGTDTLIEPKARAPVRVPCQPAQPGRATRNERRRTHAAAETAPA